METSQKFAPNPEFYTRKKWFVLEPEITILATPFWDFLADQICSTFPGDSSTLKEACFVLSKTMNSFPTLIEKFQKAEFFQLSQSTDSTAMKFKGVVILNLDIPTFKTMGDAPQYPSIFTFAHNCCILTFSCCQTSSSMVTSSWFLFHCPSSCEENVTHFYPPRLLTMDPPQRSSNGLTR